MPFARRATAAAIAALLPFAAHAQTQVTKPPVSTYGVDVETRNMSIPGMPAGGMGGMGMGGVAGMMMGGGGMGMGPQKSLYLGLRSTQKPAGALEAQHAIPPGMAMGPSLPLLPPAPARQGERSDDERLPEKPKLRMLVYWGCGDAIRPGQPVVADTQKMSMADFGKALVSRSPPERWSAIRDAQYRWPNDRDPKNVPANASLRGDQLVSGPVTPDIRFAIGERQDFMAPLELATRGPKGGSTGVSWPTIPTAQGYFLQALGFRQDGNEMIIWTSSEVQDAGHGLMGYLPNEFLRRMISEKVVMPASATSCTIPKGIFDNVEGAMLNGVAYGEELNLAHPPRPSDPKIAWEPVWAVKVRVKSTGMTMLGMDDAGESRGARGRDRGEPRGAAAPQQAPAEAPQPASPAEGALDAVKKLKGLIPF